MKSIGRIGLTLIVILLMALAGAAGASATSQGKVFVCKYVGTPGVDERLQTGQNPISVSVNAIPDSAAVGAYFADAQGRSFVLAFDIGQPEPDVSECPGGAPSPSSEPSSTPSVEPSVEPTPTPSETSSPMPSPTSTPTPSETPSSSVEPSSSLVPPIQTSNPTPPATDALAVVQTADGDTTVGWLVLGITALISGAIVYRMLQLRPKRTK